MLALLEFFDETQHLFRPMVSFKNWQYNATAQLYGKLLVIISSGDRDEGTSLSRPQD